MLGGKKKKQKQDATTQVTPERRRSRETDSYRIGRTIAGDAFTEERKAKLARLKARKKEKRKNIAIVVIVVIGLAVCGYFVVRYVMDVIAEEENKQAEVVAIEPTVDIIDENAGQNVSDRVKEFVVRLEDDAHFEGYTVDRVVLPLNKAREIHVYLKNRDEYYKMTIDRSSAVQAEDMARMIRYLDKHDKEVIYVDLRVEGKAYYK